MYGPRRDWVQHLARAHPVDTDLELWLAARHGGQTP
jgi:hypothetical protein